MKYKKKVYITLVAIALFGFVAASIYFIARCRTNEIAYKTNISISKLCYEAKLDPHLNIGVSQVKALESKGCNKYFYTRVIVKGDSSAKLQTRSNFKICSKINQVYTGFIEMNELLSLCRLPGVDYVENGTPFIITSDTEKLDIITNSNAMSLPEPIEQKKLPPPIVGIIEHSISFYEPEFMKDNVSGGRFLFVWDQKVQNGRNPVEILNSYGSEYNRADICNNSYKRKVKNRMPQDHGTQVAKIISKNIDNKIDWDMIFVKTTGEKAAIIDAVNYIFSKALSLGRPAVINISAGMDTGPHDGTSIFEVGLKSAVKPGKLIVVSGGNDRNANRHAEICSNNVVVRETGNIALPVVFYSTGHQSQVNYATIELWFTGNANTSVSVLAPNGICYGPVNYKEGRIFEDDKSKISICNSLSQQPNGDNQILVMFEDTSIQQSLIGTWSVIFSGGNLGEVWECDAWLEVIGAYSGKFLKYVDSTETITSPGTSMDIICVGDGNPAKGIMQTAKSLGPTRDGRGKPDIWCPNQGCSSFAAAKITGKVTNELAQSPNLSPKKVIANINGIN